MARQHALDEANHRCGEGPRGRGQRGRGLHRFRLAIRGARRASSLGAMRRPDDRLRGRLLRPLENRGGAHTRRVGTETVGLAEADGHPLSGAPAQGCGPHNVPRAAARRARMDHRRGVGTAPRQPLRRRPARTLLAAFLQHRERSGVPTVQLRLRVPSDEGAILPRAGEGVRDAMVRHTQFPRDMVHGLRPARMPTRISAAWPSVCRRISALPESCLPR